jgi:hypothetical protein
MKSFGVLRKDLRYFKDHVTGDLDANPVAVRSHHLLDFYEQALAVNSL